MLLLKNKLIDMFYKYEENNDKWNRGLKVTLPTGEVLSEDNKIELDGWKWYDEAPQVYLDWKEAKELEELKLLKELE